MNRGRSEPTPPTPIDTRLREIATRWSQPQRVSRFGDGVKHLLNTAVDDIAFLLALEAEHRMVRPIGFRMPEHHHEQQ